MFLTMLDVVVKQGKCCVRIGSKDGSVRVLYEPDHPYVKHNFLRVAVPLLLNDS